MRRWRLSAAVSLVLGAVACCDDALAPGPPPCVAAGGRCVARVTSGPAVGASQCGAEDIVFAPPPRLCDDEVEDCCFRRCPATRPGVGDPCDAENRSCQYSDTGACVQAICVQGSWWLSVSAC
jgi:hypothetical protein